MNTMNMKKQTKKKDVPSNSDKLISECILFYTSTFYRNYLPFHSKKWYSLLV